MGRAPRCGGEIEKLPGQPLCGGCRRWAASAARRGLEQVNALLSFTETRTRTATVVVWPGEVGPMNENQLKWIGSNLEVSMETSRLIS